MPLNDALEEILGSLSRATHIVVLTGAGISSESGIPTFRGPEGYWTVGSASYRAEELATWAAFQDMPEEIWSWYLYRRSACRDARPNVAHQALVRLEGAIGDRFRLITQNVDGLHGRAGQSPERTFEVHGNIQKVRCSEECSPIAWPLPAFADTDWSKERRIASEEIRRLACPRCGARGRPHVLWFDESYDEARYRLQSSLNAAARATLLLVVGTTGTTGLPQMAARAAADAGAALITVDPEMDPFGAWFRRKLHLRERAGEAVPRLVQQLTHHCS